MAEQLPRVRGLAGKLLMESFIGARVGPCRRLRLLHSLRCYTLSGAARRLEATQFAIIEHAPGANGAARSDSPDSPVLAAVLTMPPLSAYTQTATVPGPYGIPQTGQAVPRALRTPTPHDLFPR